MDNSINASLPPGGFLPATPTSKTLPPTASTFSLQGTMTKQEIVAWLNDMKKEDPKTYQLLLLTILEQIQKDLGK